MRGIDQKKEGIGGRRGNRSEEEERKIGKEDWKEEKRAEEESIV